MAHIVTEDQLADYLQTSRRHLQGLRQRGHIPWIRLGSLVRYDLEAIDAWLSERPEATGAASEPRQVAS